MGVRNKNHSVALDQAKAHWQGDADAEEGSLLATEVSKRRWESV